MVVRNTRLRVDHSQLCNRNTRKLGRRLRMRAIMEQGRQHHDGILTGKRCSTHRPMDHASSWQSSAVKKDVQILARH